ncbi:hypothetical protein H6G20_15435 [Desertifilum sp. FACHB-1129]|uniref:Uncharacterized protein n=1 Tax=Desertifilum tharense IPPAS B-1220 TaxID=1781255 RepID=A0ACD5GWT3_9CYAN|nr:MULTISPECIES: hypothetical protein [Desertifilum]MBD2313060.1 hypothetical protein [Desertifilum sp. FACHB-1129]MBD2320894.1 hypothetical protein [Desertifilum sp. FACHB-866]MBD2331023.1 hypothetical protein [Desertifilum sp. FACHB-868]MDA0209650.1 hypothetical protein [Cyanobacteria bacterium FC1]
MLERLIAALTLTLLLKAISLGQPPTPRTASSLPQEIAIAWSKLAQ